MDNPIIKALDALLDDQEQRHSDITERSRLWDRAWEALSQRDLSRFDQTMKQFWKLGERAQQ